MHYSLYIMLSYVLMILFFSTGILEGSAEDFETSDDLFDAIGDMLLETAEQKSENEVHEICEHLVRILKK